ncbi:MAG: hypothetical protein ACFFD4_10580 [Candidatus Odinarchaeota archaeon]
MEVRQLFGAIQPQDDKSRFLFLTSCQDYFKNNENRIVSHSLARTETPLASRSDLKPFVSIVKGDFADLFTLNQDGRKSFTRCLEYDDLVAHFDDDPNLVDSLITLRNSGLEDTEFNFLTNGVIMPSLISRTADNVSELAKEVGCDDEKEFSTIFHNINFYEVRFDVQRLHKMSDHKLYLRNLISRVRRLEKTFTPVQKSCECGTHLLQGKYVISYWKKEQKLTYFICPQCGIQTEPEENSSAVMNFVAGLT